MKKPGVMGNLILRLRDALALLELGWLGVCSLMTSRGTSKHWAVHCTESLRSGPHTAIASFKPVSAPRLSHKHACMRGLACPGPDCFGTWGCSSGIEITAAVLALLSMNTANGSPFWETGGFLGSSTSRNSKPWTGLMTGPLTSPVPHRCRLA